MRRLVTLCVAIGANLFAGGLFAAGAAQAQEPKPAAMSQAEAAARRFPQPVRVGDLLNRRVLAPRESQPTLGWVREVVRQSDGTIDVVVNYGGWFGFFARPIAVPVDAMALLGQYMEILDLTTGQLDTFATFASGGTPIGPDTTINIALARPSH